MNQMLELAAWKPLPVPQYQGCERKYSKQVTFCKSQQTNGNYKTELNGNLRPEKHSFWNFKIHMKGLAAEWR